MFKYIYQDRVRNGRTSGAQSQRREPLLYWDKVTIFVIFNTYNILIFKKRNRVCVCDLPQYKVFISGLYAIALAMTPLSRPPLGRHVGITDSRKVNIIKME